MSFISGTAAAPDHTITQKAGAPVVTDDIDAGFSVGDIIVDTSASPREGYECTDNSVGAAVWENITTFGEGVSLDNIDDAPDAAPDVDGPEILLKAGDGGAHTANDPDGSSVGFEPGAKGAGGAGADGVFFVRQPGGDNTKQIEFSHDGTDGFIVNKSGNFKLIAEDDKDIFLVTDDFTIILDRSQKTLLPLTDDDIKLGSDPNRFEKLFLSGILDIDLHADVVGLKIKANASQTADLLQIQNSAGAALLTVLADGSLSDLVNLHIVDPTVSEVGLNIYATAFSNGEKVSLQLGNNVDPEVGNDAFRMSMLKVSSSIKVFLISHVNNGVEGQIIRISEDGELRIGATDAEAEQVLHVEGSALIEIGGGPTLELRKRDSSVFEGDLLGAIQFGSLEDTGALHAEIRCEADGTSGAADWPGRIRFLTTPENSTTLTEVFRIDSEQNIIIADGNDIVLDTTTGTKLGTGTTQKLGLWDTTPVVQPAHIADASGGGTVDAEARTAIASINAMLAITGLTAAA